MTIIKIDGKDFDTEKLPKEVKIELAKLRLCDQKIRQLQVDIAIAQTARKSYAMVIKKLMPKTPD
jgi:hypothetical protein